MLQPERCRHALLVVRAERRERADGAGDRGGDLPEGALEALGVAVGLHRVAGELEAERGRLGVDAVRAADAQRARVLARLLGQLVRERALGAGTSISPARLSCSASPVSTTSEDVSP